MTSVAERCSASFEAIGAVAACLAVTFAVPLFMALATRGPIDVTVTLLYLLAAQSLFFVVAGILLRRSRCRPEQPTGDRTEQVVAGLGLGLAMIAGTAAISFVLKAHGFDPHESEAILHLASQGGLRLAGFIAVAVLLAPVGEELLMRGYAFTRIAQGTGRLPAYLISALLFAAMHVNPSAFPLYLFQGLVLAFAYEVRRSIATPIVAHAFNNAGVLFLVLQ